MDRTESDATTTEEGVEEVEEITGHPFDDTQILQGMADSLRDYYDAEREFIQDPSYENWQEMLEHRNHLNELDGKARALDKIIDGVGSLIHDLDTTARDGQSEES